MYNLTVVIAILYNRGVSHNSEKIILEILIYFAYTNIIQSYILHETEDDVSMMIAI